MKRIAQTALFAALLAALALGFPHGTQAQPAGWVTVTVDNAAGDRGSYTSIAVRPNGDPVISYHVHPAAGHQLWFATCDMSASTNVNCDQPGDWKKVKVDDVAEDTSIAVVGPDGDPVISYVDEVWHDLKFATCDMSASANKNCDQAGDWKKVTVDRNENVQWYTSIAVDSSDRPMISYFDLTASRLKFAFCDMLATNCWMDVDENNVADDWVKRDVGEPGTHSSIAVDPDDNPVISYYSAANPDLRVATCDMTTGCDDPVIEWKKLTVDDAGGNVGQYNSIALDINGDPVISYRDAAASKLKFATCRITTGCDAAGKWTKVFVDESGKVGNDTSIAVDDYLVPFISYSLNVPALNNLMFATCDRATDCDAPNEWKKSTVDNAGTTGKGSAGTDNSIAVDINGDLMISYQDDWNGDLKFATGDAPVFVAVGGLAELPAVSDSSGRNYVALAALATAALLALTAGAWYARRRLS